MTAMSEDKSAIFLGLALCCALLIPPVFAAGMDGVMMISGKVVMMRAGKPAGPMEHQITMSNGAVVSSDGTVRLKDGARFHMKDGQMMMMDGHLMNGGKAMEMHR